METRTPTLHPLLTLAAISVTVLSAVGVATLTGLIPQSIGSQAEPAAQALPAPVITTVEAPKAVPKVAAKPAPKPVRAEPAVYQAPPQVVYSPAPKVAVPSNAATVVAVREVKQPGEHTALGPIAGGIAGAVIGDQLGGKGNARKVVTVLGAAGGALAGREIEKHARAATRWEVEVRHPDGRHETLTTDAAPGFAVGERVRVVDGRLQPA